MDVLSVASLAKDLLVGLFVVLSLALTVIGCLSYRKTGIGRIFMVTVFFTMFLIESLFLVVGLYLTDWISVPGEFALTFDVMLAVNVSGLFILYLALFRKKRERSGE